MTTYEVFATGCALLSLLMLIVFWIVIWHTRRDRRFAFLTPGEIPTNPDEAPTRFVQRSGYRKEQIEAMPTPPPGVSPGLAGVVLNSSVDGREIAAMILDLEQRGWLMLSQVNGTSGMTRDWEIARVDKPLDASLGLEEVYLITNLDTTGESVRLSELCDPSDHRLSFLRSDLNREAVSRGWYAAPPNRNTGSDKAVLGLGCLIGIVIPLLYLSRTTVFAGIVVIVFSFLTAVVVRGTPPRTALGTAVRVQTLGFGNYLSEAKSHQFSYSNAIETFRAYLPWALVLGIENHWVELFSKIGVAETSGLSFAHDLCTFEFSRERKRITPSAKVADDETTPRRGAYSEEDVTSTVFVSPEELAQKQLAAGSHSSDERRGPRRGAYSEEDATATVVVSREDVAIQKGKAGADALEDGPVPRRGGYSEEDVLSTVFVSPEEVARRERIAASQALEDGSVPRRGAFDEEDVTATVFVRPEDVTNEKQAQ